MQYPKTSVRKVTEIIHGHKIVDPYRWLENSKSKAIQKWTDEQNTLTDKTIPTALRKTFAKEVKQNFQFALLGTPSRFGKRYFWWEVPVGKQQGILYVREGLRGKKRALIDLNILSKKKTLSLDYWVPSRSGALLAYGLSEAGKEVSTLKILDVASSKNIEIVAPNASDASMVWLPDDSGLYYTRNPDPGTVPSGDERYYQKVYFHKLGSNPKSDKLIFGDGRSKEDMTSLSLSLDGQWLALSVGQNWVQNDIYLYNTENKKLKGLIIGLKGQFGLSFSPQFPILYTDYHAPNGRLLLASYEKMPDSFSDWKEFLPEGKHRLQSYHMTRDKLLVSFLVDATERAYIYDYAGKRRGEVPMPPNASLLEVSSNPDYEEFFYQYVSYVQSGITMRYQPKTGIFHKYRELGSRITPENYRVKQEWFVSKDGTRIPMFIIHSKRVKLDGRNPTILYGYGGFDSPGIPAFLRSYIPWLERGGIFVEANIRGGGEFGKKWHTDATLKNKQRSYDDFIAAAKHLIAGKYTNAERLGISGGSNGGLLISAVAMQRPQLFRAVKANVPLTDMVRFPLTHIASRWTSEYGDPSKVKDLAYILRYSPYHNVKSGTKYPAFLFTTGINDTRVDPLHARKMTALLQASTSSDRPVLIYTDKGTGHTGSLTMNSFYENSGRSLAFFAQELDLRM